MEVDRLLQLGEREVLQPAVDRQREVGAVVRRRGCWRRPRSAGRAGCGSRGGCRPGRPATSATRARCLPGRRRRRSCSRRRAPSSRPAGTRDGTPCCCRIPGMPSLPIACAAAAPTWRFRYTKRRTGSATLLLHARRAASRAAARLGDLGRRRVELLRFDADRPRRDRRREHVAVAVGDLAARGRHVEVDRVALLALALQEAGRERLQVDRAQQQREERDEQQAQDRAANARPAA